MISDEELTVEAKGSAADIAAACSSVKYQIHKQLEPWMNGKQFQLSFDIVIRCDDATNQSNVVHAGLSLPEGWALIDKTGQAKSEDNAFDPPQNCFSSVVKCDEDPSSDRVYHSTLNGLLMHTNPQYKENKDQELMDRVMQLAAEKQLENDD